MKIPFLEPESTSGALSGVVRDAVLQELCDRRQFAILATPYLNFHARFLERRDGEIRLKVRFGQDTVRHAMKDHPLRLRFDWALAFYAGATQVLGYEQIDKDRILRVEIPHHFAPHEARSHFRIERVGHSTGTLATREGILLRTSVEDISMGGVGLFVIDAMDPEQIRTGMELDISIELEDGPAFHCGARLCHSDGQNLGLAFLPGRSERDLESLQAWLDPRIQDARRRWENRAELRARAEQAARPKEQPAGILFLTQNEALAEQVSSVLSSVQPVRVLPPAMGALMEAQSQPPLLVIVDPCRADVEERRRCRALLEKVAMKAPLVVLGDGQNPEGGRQLATELKGMYLAWKPTQEVFCQRFISGLIQQFWRSALGEL